MFDFDKEPGQQLHKEAVGEKAAAQPLVTVITPFFNAGNYIRQTYQCMRNQTFPWFEWLIVDDGSTEAADVRLLHELCDTDARISVIRRKENGGIAAARNTGVQKAAAEILVMLDADDLIAPTYLEVLYWMLYFHPECDWAYTNTVGFQEQQYLWDQPFDSKRLKTNNFLTYSAAIRKDALREVGGYDVSEKYCYEDWHLWLRLLKAGKRPVKSALYGFWYRRLDTGVLGKINTDPAIRRRALQLIRQAAEGVPDGIEIPSFPCRPAVNRFLPLTVSKWERAALPAAGKYPLLFLVPWLRMGGSEIFELEILKNIDRRLFSVTVATTVDAPLEWRQKFEQYTDDIWELPSFLEQKDYPEFMTYLIRSRGIRLVFVTNSYYGYSLMPWLRIQFPSLAMLDYVHMEEWYWRRGGYARISSSMREITEHTYVCSEHTRQVLLHAFGRKEETVSTLHIGTDPDWYDPELVEAGVCYRTWGIPQNKSIVLFPCRMDPQKRPFLMLEIAQETKRRQMDVVYVAAGEGLLLRQLQEACARKGLKDTVFFVGQVDDLRPYYKDAAVTLNCSIHEGIALTSYESFAMGVPVVSADVGGQGELLDAQTGKLLPVFQKDATDYGKNTYTEQEVRQYADALQEILTDREAYLRRSAACRRRIQEDFSVKHMVRELEAIFCHYIEDPQVRKAREEQAAWLQKFPSLVEELMVCYHELEGREGMYQSGFSPEAKNELMRIAQSKWGRRLIRWFVRLRSHGRWR